MPGTPRAAAGAPPAGPALGAPGTRELLRDLVGAYDDARKAQRATIAYALHGLEERGELLHEGVDDALVAGAS